MATKLELGKVKDHFAAQKANNGIGTEKITDVRETLQENLGQFAAEVYRTRTGSAEDAKGNKIAAYDIPLAEAVGDYFGASLPQFLRGLGIYTGTDTLQSVASRFGVDGMNQVAFEKLLVEHSSYNGTAPNNTTGISGERFLVPELFMNAIRTGYIGGSMHQNWIAGTTPLSKRDVTMPQIQRGNTMPSKINEGADIPKGSLRFGSKKASTYKIGMGFQVTDEVLIESSLDMVFLFMQEVGNDMSIGADVAAIDVLLNGEQKDGSESAPVIGVDTIGQFKFIDLQRAFTRLRRLGVPAERVIAGEADGIDITSIDRFQGFQGDTRLATIQSILGVPGRFTLDTFPLADDQIMFLNPARAMTKLTFRGLVVERRRNPSNQTEETFVTDNLNFAIVKRDARLIVDKSVDFATVGFPSYMDIDARIKESFTI